MSEPDRSLRVFLCHASADKPAVRELYRRLEDDGVDAWLDTQDLLPGQNWRVEIPNAVRDSDVVLICLSENSVNKEGYVQKEITFALDKAMEMPEGRIFLIPTRLEDCQVPERLSTYQWVDLFSENGYERLMLALKIRAEQIGAQPPEKKGWLPIRRQISRPVVSKVKRGTPVGEGPIGVPNGISTSISVKPARPTGASPKLKKEYVIAAFGVVAVIVVALIASPLIKRWFTQTPIPTLPPAAQTQALPTEPSVPVTATETIVPPQPFTPSPTALPSEFTDSKGVQMVLVAEGEFTMGSDKGDTDEQPVRDVFLDSFYIDKFEVTNSRYSDCVSSGVCQPPVVKSSKTHSDYYGNFEFNDYPVIYVNLYMAKTYCAWRNAQLPTEAEWEKAARGTDRRTYPWGESISCNYSNFDKCIGDTTPVGRYEIGKSFYGLYDMAGNVWEWVADWYDEDYYSISPVDNPKGPSFSPVGLAIVRGGSWSGGTEFASRLSNRASRSPDKADMYIGFRCARSP